MRAATRLVASCALLLGMGLSSGCYFMSALYEAGRSEEYPNKKASFPGGAVLEAYASHDGRRLCIKYRVAISRPRDLVYGDRWLSISREWVDKTVREGTAYRTKNGAIYCEECVPKVSDSRKCNVTQMDRLEVYLVKDRRDLRAGKVLGVFYRHHMSSALRGEGLTEEDLSRCTCTVHYVYAMTRTDSDDADLVVFRLPTVVAYRTTGGYVVQVFQPFAAVLDILTFPIQLPAMVEH